MGVTALYMDLDDTLHDFSGVSSKAMSMVYGYVREAYGADEGHMRKIYSGLLREAREKAFADGRSSVEHRKERFGNMLLQLGIKDTGRLGEMVGIYAGGLEAGMRLYPGTEEVLKGLKEEMDMYLVTEGPEDAQLKAVDMLGIGKYFSGVFISGKAGRMKSDGGLFRYALEMTGHGPAQVVHVGDSYARDVAGAMKAGIRAVWLNRKGAVPESAEVLPMAQIRRIGQLPGILEGISRQTALR